MKFLTTTILLLLYFAVIKSQQFSMPSQLKQNMMYLNPAYAGYFKTTVTSIMHRSKWVGFSGAQFFQNLEAHAPLKKQSVALGAQFKNEKLGATINREAFLNYCHRIRIDNSLLAFGLKGGIRFKGIDKILLPEVDPAFSENSIPFLNFGFGISFYSNNYFGGLSVPYLLTNTVNAAGEGEINVDINNYNFLLTAGAKVAINDEFYLEPVAALNYSLVFAPQFVFILNTGFKNSLKFGAGYRHNEAILFNAGYALNAQLSFLYSYDYNIGIVGQFAKGSHEIGIMWRLGYVVNTINPRDF